MNTQTRRPEVAQRPTDLYIIFLCAACVYNVYAYIANSSPALLPPHASPLLDISYDICI